MENTAQLAGVVLLNRYRISSYINRGSYGAVYRGTDYLEEQSVAIKVNTSKIASIFQKEINLLSALQGSKHTGKFYGFGWLNGCHYLVMDLLGPNLDELLQNSAEKQFSGKNAVYLAIQMVEAVEDIHNAGYLHCDIKPSNITVGLKQNSDFSLSNIYFVDFGSSLQFKDRDGNRLPAKNSTFRGTLKYASLNAILKLELSPIDDLWSVFFTLMKLMLGYLPWDNMTNIKEIIETRQMFFTVQWLSSLPRSLVILYELIKKMDRNTIPNYNDLKTALQLELNSKSPTTPEKQ
ncbi:putative serine/threonine-protein kinase [Trichinella pseudospiralis]|uniref:non-specific serine/threonine protein kinase n=1 Tax=Trichinella pseudospiralis TaxID=6337 RepID=A0A0V1J6A3_TRIPS|nr:putative serine/threonine-protein kinase [Trichinella pseudospiralis]